MHRLPLHERIVQDMPEHGQADHLIELSKGRHQDLRPIALPLPLLLGCMQTEPRADSGFRDLWVCCCLVVGRWLAEEELGEFLAPYHPTPPPLQTTPSLLDISTLDTMLPLLDTQPWPADRSQVPPGECFRI